MNVFLFYFRLIFVILYIYLCSYISQVQRVESAYEKLSAKFDEFKRPKGFEQRLSRVERTFAMLEHNLDMDVTIHNSEQGVDAHKEMCQVITVKIFYTIVNNM